MKEKKIVWEVKKDAKKVGENTEKMIKKVTIFSGMKGDKNFRSDKGVLGDEELKGKNLYEEEVGINNWAYES